MNYRIELTEDAKADLKWFRVYERKTILDGIKDQLSHEPLVETRNRKELHDSPLAPWELRIEGYRAFYRVEQNDLVKVAVIGYKEHNILYVRGKVVEV